MTFKIATLNFKGVKSTVAQLGTVYIDCMTPAFAFRYFKKKNFLQLMSSLFNCEQYHLYLFTVFHLNAVKCKRLKSRCNHLLSVTCTVSRKFRT